MLTLILKKCPEGAQLTEANNFFFFPPQCLQDKSVAFKIFELGLKKYGDIPEYVLAYIDYLSHLNGKL